MKQLLGGDILEGRKKRGLKKIGTTRRKKRVWYSEAEACSCAQGVVRSVGHRLEASSDYYIALAQHDCLKGYEAHNP